MGLDDLPPDVYPILFNHLLYRPLARLALTNAVWAQRALQMVTTPSVALALAEEIIAAAQSFDDLDAVIQRIARHDHIELVHFDLNDFRFPQAHKTFLCERTMSDRRVWRTYVWRDAVKHEIPYECRIEVLTSTTQMLASAKAVIPSCVRLRTPQVDDVSDNLSQLLVATTLRLPPVTFLDVCQPWFKPLALLRSRIPIDWYRDKGIPFGVPSTTPYDIACARAKSLRRNEWTPAQLAQLIAIGLASHHTETDWSEPSMIAIMLSREFPPGPASPEPQAISEQTNAVLQLVMPPHALTSQSTWFHFICSDVYANNAYGTPHLPSSRAWSPLLYLAPQDSRRRLNVDPLVAHAATLALPSFYRLVEVAAEQHLLYNDDSVDWHYVDACDEYSGPEECFRAFLHEFIAQWAGKVNFPAAFSCFDQAYVCKMLDVVLDEDVKDLLGRDALAWIQSANCSQTTALICDALARKS